MKNIWKCDVRRRKMIIRTALRTLPEMGERGRVNK
jgi:hypothetical protein